MAETQGRNWAAWGVAFGLICLSASVVYVGQQLRDAIQLVNGLTPGLPALIEQSDQWRAEVDQAISLTDQQLPLLLAEVNASNRLLAELTPQLLGEVAAVRQLVDNQLPPVLAETAALRQLVDAQLPALLQQLPPLLAEVKAVRTQTVPSVLDESEALRRDLPVMLDEAGLLLDKARDAGREASQGAVTGVLRLPLDFLFGAGEFVLGGKVLKPEEGKALRKVAEELLAKDEVGKPVPFKLKSGIQGEGELLAKHQGDQEGCRTLRLRAARGTDQPQELRYLACRNGKYWAFTEIKE